MNTTNKIGRNTLIYLTITLFLSVVSIALRCVNLTFFYDSSIGYYRPDSLLPVIGSLLLIAGATFSIVFSWIQFRKIPIAYGKATPVALRLSACVGALGFLYLAVTTAKTGASFPATLFAMGACLYFLLIAAEKGTPLLQVLSGLCVIVRLLLNLAQSYFNIHVPMNAPDKLIFQLGCLVGMIFLVEELRASASRIRPALYMISAGCAVLLTGVASIPSIIAYHSGILEDTGLLPACYALLALFVYATCRLILLCLRPVPTLEESVRESEATATTTEEAEASDSPIEINEEAETSEEEENVSEQTTNDHSESQE